MASSHLQGDRKGRPYPVRTGRPPVQGRGVGLPLWLAPALGAAWSASLHKDWLRWLLTRYLSPHGGRPRGVALTGDNRLRECAFWNLVLSWRLRWRRACWRMLARK